MLRSRRRTVGAALVILAVVGSSAVAGVTTANAEPALDWHPCQDDNAVECATMPVPIDWANPDAGTIDLAVARKKATDQANRIGTLVYMPGGPGGSGVDELIGGTPLPDEVTARFDVVSYDPRGTNRSNPVRCDGDILATQPNLIPEAGGTLRESLDYANKLGESCRANSGALLDHIDNVSVAHDIDAFRAALGEETISLYGISYGTLAGQMYAENFPERIRALLLDSTFDHSLSARDFLVTEAETGEDSFAEFANWCAGDTTCALHGQDVTQVWDGLYAKAVAGDLPDPDNPGQPLDAFALINRTIGFFYGPNWTGAADYLKSLTAQESTASTKASGEPVPFPLGAACSDMRVNLHSERQWLDLWRDQNEAAPTMRTHFAWQAVSMCAGWPADTPNPQHDLDIDGTPPILVMNALHDPATGYAWAENVASQIDDSVLLTYDGWGHGVIDRSECTTNAGLAYLVDGTLPEPGTHCAAVPPQPATYGATAKHW